MHRQTCRQERCFQGQVSVVSPGKPLPRRYYTYLRVFPTHRLQHLLQSLGRTTKQIRSAEPLVLTGESKVRLEREEAIIAVGPQTLQKFGPMRDTLSCSHDAAVGARIFHMDVPQPGTERLVGIGVRRLPALNEVGGIEHGLKVCIVAALQQIDTASDGITVDAFLVLMEQDHARRARPCSHFTQPSQHLVAVLGWVDGTTVISLLLSCGRIEGKDANIGRLQGMRQRNGPLETVEVLIERAIDGHLPDGRANGSNADTVRIQRFLGPGYLRIGEIQHIRILDAAQVQEVDLLTTEHGNLFTQIRGNLISESRKANHDSVTSR